MLLRGPAAGSSSPRIFLRPRSVLPLTEAARRHLPPLADLSGEDWGLLLVLSTRSGLLESGPRPLRRPAAGCFWQTLS